MKKLFLKGFVTMIALCLSLMVQAQQTTPYFEDFEGMTTGSTPTGWDNSASTTTTSLTGSYVWGVYEYGGNKMIRMYNWGVARGITCINTPAITLPATGTCQLVFKYSHTATCGDFKVKIKVGNDTAFTDLATYQKGDGTDRNDPGEFTEAAVSLNSHLGQSVTIQFWASSDNGSGAIFVDDVEIGPEPTCVPPVNLQASDITATQANFSWTASDHNETQWQYLCIPASATPDWTTAVLFSDSSAILNNLVPNTNYKFYIRSYCSSTDQSKAKSISFKTLCAAVTPQQMGVIGFEESEGFTSGSGNLAGNNCWYAGSFKSTSSSYIPYVYAYGGFDGEYSLMLSATVTTNARTGAVTNNDSAYAILPELIFTGGIENYHMQMRIKRGGNTSASQTYRDSLIVALVANPANPRNYTVLGYAVATSNSDYQLADVSFANAASATGNYIMLIAACPSWATTTSVNSKFYVDNIEIKKTKLCATPTDIAVSNIQPRSVEVSWTGSSNARIMLATSDVMYPETYTEWAIDTNVTTNPATIVVEPATDYYLYVQCICTDSSDVSYVPVLFQSGCDAITTLPWIEDFEDCPLYEDFKKPCWTNLHTEGENTDVFAYVDKGNGGNSTTHIELQNYGYSGDVIELSLPQFDIPTANAYEFSISVYRLKDDMSRNLFNEGVYIITDNAAGDDFDTLFIPHFTEFAGSVGTENHDDWYTYSVVLPKAGVNSIKVRHLAAGGTTMYVDNFQVRTIPTCPQVRHLTATDVQPRQASLDWTATGAANYQVVLTTVAINPDTIETVPDSLIAYNDTVAADSAVATGLVPTVLYYAYVRGICGAENGAWAASISFRTPCEDLTITAADTYFQGFEDVETGQRYVPCWDFIMTSVTSSSQSVILASKTGSYVARTGSKLFSYGNTYGVYNAPNDTSILILPQTTNDVKDLRLQFWFACGSSLPGLEYADTLIAGVITDISDKSTFVPVAKFHADELGVYQLAEATFEEYTGAQGRIAIKRIPVCYTPRGQHWGSIIDDITIDLAPSCVKVKDVKAEATENSALITWRATAAESYNVIIADAAINADELDSAAMSHIVYTLSTTGDSLLVDGLAQNTSYFAYVIGDCGEGDVASASSVCKFATVWGTPYMQNFDTVVNFPAEMVQYEATDLDGVIAGESTLYPVSDPLFDADWKVSNILGNDTVDIKMTINNDDHFRLMATPALMMRAADSISVSFDVCKRAYNSASPAEDAENEDDKFYVMLANEAMTSFTVLDTWANDESGNNVLRDDIGTEFSNVRIDISDYVDEFEDGIYRIVFAAGSMEEDDEYDLHIDNVMVFSEAELVVVASHDERGTVTGSCTTYVGAQVEITATATGDYRFYGWSNGDKNATTTYTVASRYDTITAIFITDSVTLVVTSDNEEMGTVTGSGYYGAGDTVSVTAVPETGFVFSRWSDGNTDAVRNIIVLDDQTLVAYFDTMKVTVTVNITGEGTVTGDGEYNYGDQVTLVATPAEGYEFTSWTMNSQVTTDATLTFTITENVTVEALFSVKTAVEDVEAVEYVAYTEGTRINVVGADNRTVAVYDASGRLVSIVEKANRDEHFNVNVPGVYFINVAGLKPTAVVVK